MDGLLQRKNRAKIGYARVCAMDPDLALQMRALQKAGCQTIFRETLGGAYRPRPELQRLLEEIRQGDTVVAWRLDRLARSTRDLVNIMERIHEAGGRFQSLLEPWANTTTQAGQTIATFFAGLVEFERGLLSERIESGREAAKERGLHFGRPRKLNPDQVEAVSRLVAEGRAIRDVAKTFHVHETTIYRLAADLLEQDGKTAQSPAFQERKL